MILLFAADYLYFRGSSLRKDDNHHWLRATDPNKCPSTQTFAPAERTEPHWKLTH